MTKNPLAEPGPGSSTLAVFSEHFRLERQESAASLIESVATAFSSIPYENLTKILKQDHEGAQAARRCPEEVIKDHIRLGSGGTCFSLTAALLHILRALGLRAEPILADRHYGDNTHCALLVWFNERPHLLDPGYLILRPLPLPEGEETSRIVPTSFNELLLKHRKDGSRIELHTSQQGSVSHRLTFKAEPAEDSDFLDAWDASFGWDMMRYPLLTRVRGAEQLYLQGSRFQRRSRETVERAELSAAPEIASTFGIEEGLVARALALFSRRGEEYD